MDVVSKTWYREIKTPTNFYTAVKALQFFMHLIANCGGLHETDAVIIQASMMKFYNNAKGIPQYINVIEEAQVQAERASLPISDNVLLAIANRARLASIDYSKKTKKWNKLVPASCKWDLWKLTYQEVYIANRRDADICGDQGIHFWWHRFRSWKIQIGQKCRNFWHRRPRDSAFQRSGGLPR